MSAVLKYSRFARLPISSHARALATPAASGSPVPKKSPFAATLADGPSLDDFVSDNAPERIVLGNKNTYAETSFSQPKRNLTTRAR
jgi:lipoic acid synthetase